MGYTILDKSAANPARKISVAAGHPVSERDLNDNGQFGLPDITVAQMQERVRQKMGEIGFPGFLAGFSRAKSQSWSAGRRAGNDSVIPDQDLDYLLPASGADSTRYRCVMSRRQSALPIGNCIN